MSRLSYNKRQVEEWVYSYLKINGEIKAMDITKHFGIAYVKTYQLLYCLVHRGIIIKIRKGVFVAKKLQ